MSAVAEAPRKSGFWERRRSSGSLSRSAQTSWRHRCAGLGDPSKRPSVVQWVISAYVLILIGEREADARGGAREGRVNRWTALTRSELPANPAKICRKAR